MTLAQLREQCMFEGRIQDVRSAIGWLDSVIQEEARAITGLIKYDELYMPDTVLTLAAAATSATLPTDLQHIDSNNIRYAQGGSLTNQIVLRHKTNFTNNILGRPRLFVRKGSLILISPYTSIGSTDTIQINYWKYPITLAIQSDSTVILPESIIPELRMRVIQRCLTFSDPKLLPIYRAQQNDKRSSMIGQTRLGGMSGV